MGFLRHEGAGVTRQVIDGIERRDEDAVMGHADALQILRQRALAFLFAVGEEDRAADGQALLHPLHEFRAIGVAGIVLDLADRRLDADFLAHDGDGLGAILQDAAQ